MKQEEKLGIKLERKTLFFVAILLLVLNITLWQEKLLHHSPLLTVAFLDIGQGDAVLIEAPNGNRILYDAGPDTKVLTELRPFMHWWDKEIDLGVLSHSDQDHIGGFPAVISRLKVRAIMDASPEVHVENDVYKEIYKVAEKYNLPIVPARAGETITLGDGVFADILHPFRGGEYRDANTASVVLRLRYGSTTLLLTGDLPQSGEEILSERYGNGIESQVLMAGHHGSKTATGDMFLNTVAPELVIISAGRNNRYGHPNQEVLERLTAHHIPYIGTYASGTVSMTSDGTHWFVK